MADKSYQNPHAEHEANLAHTIAQETLRDLFGGEIRPRNVTGLLLAIGVIAGLLAITAVIIIIL